jgi:biopolymer transport protein ExbB
MIRSMLISQASTSINSNIDLIKVCTAVAPLFGLFGTITGMMEVFHILAVTGGGDAKAMAGGVARSTIPAMAGLFASIPALLALRSIDQAAKKNIEILTERLTYDKKFDVI